MFNPTKDQVPEKPQAGLREETLTTAPAAPGQETPESEFLRRIKIEGKSKEDQ